MVASFSIRREVSKISRPLIWGSINLKVNAHIVSCRVNISQEGIETTGSGGKIDRG